MRIFPEKQTAADFISRMQTDPNLTLQIKLTDHVPIHEMEIETEAKAPNVSLSNINEIARFSEEPQPAVDEQFITQLKAHGLYDHIIAKEPSDDPEIHITGFFSLSSIPQVNLIETNDFQDTLNDSPSRAEPLDLVQEHQNAEVIREVVSWKNRGNPGELPNLQLALRKYRKQFHRLVVEDDVLYRLFYDDCGKVKYKEFGVPKTLWRDLFSASIIRKLPDFLALPKQLKNFEKVSLFQILPTFSVLQLKTALPAYN